MPPVEVYLDDCIALGLARLLEAGGLVVHLPEQVGTARVSDSGHLMTCMRGGWVLVTQNRRDFRRLHWLWTALHDWGLLPEQHPGILTIHEQVGAGGQTWAAAIVDLLQAQASLKGRMYRWRPASARWEIEPARLM
jgi:hypothetical protein